MNICFIAPDQLNRYMGAQKTLSYTYYFTAAGRLLVYMCDLGIISATFSEDDICVPDNYFYTEQLADTLVLTGTTFQISVWNTVLSMQKRTTTYADVARAVGKPSAYRAVACALASNKIAYFIPCHRVIASDGSLCGYKWGMARKKKLLDVQLKNFRLE